MKIVLSVLIILTFQSVAKAKKRSPNQQQEVYYQCILFKDRIDQVLKMSLRNPVHKNELVFEKSNRNLKLTVYLEKEGRVTFRLFDRRLKQLVAQGKVTTDFNSNFVIKNQHSGVDYTFNCEI